jgi:MscS family membrane protein
MENFISWWKGIVWHQYIYSFLILFASLILGRIILYILKNKYAEQDAKKEVNFPSLLIRCISKPIMVFIIFVGIYFSLFPLGIMKNPKIWEAVQTVRQLAFSVAVAYLIYSLVDIVEHYLMHWASRTENKLDDMLVGLARKTLRIMIVIMLGIYLIEQFSGKPIGTILAGLGIGGLALALAAQDTVKNIFGFIKVIFDKPFVIGERIVVNDIDGTIEEMGFLSTRIRTLIGHLVTIPNSTMANSIINNISRRPYIRRLVNITITYDTPIKKIEKAVEIIKNILEKYKDKMHPDFPSRVFFNEFNDYSLNILVLYWYYPPSYWDYLELNQKINLQIMREFEKEGIEFAFPTQTVYLANDDRRQLALKILNDNKKQK